MSFLKNDKAVSPVVATLVLIVVAIIGAAAVGALLGVFSGNVGQQANAQGTSAAASTTLSVVGSTTMQPASEKLATTYEAKHQGVQINVQGGGSGAGVTAVGQGIADIGSASRAVKDTEMTTYPNLKSYEIGACAACFITSGATPITIDQLALETAYTSTTMPGTITKVYTRSDSSGTKDVVYSWLGAGVGDVAVGSKTLAAETSLSGAIGSQDMLDKVAGDAHSLGYVDYGFAANDGRVSVVPLTETADVVNRKVLGSGGKRVLIPTGATGETFVTGGSTTLTPGKDGANILTELKTSGTTYGKTYPEGLIQPLYYITNGAPNTLQQDFIKYAQSPDGCIQMNAVNYFGVTQYK